MWQSGSNDLRNVTKVVQQIKLCFACILTLHDDDDDENLEVVEDLVCCQQGQLASLYWAAISSLDNLPAHVIFAVLDIWLCCHYPWLLTGNFLGYYLLSFIVVRILYAFEFLLFVSMWAFGYAMLGRLSAVFFCINVVYLECTPFSLCLNFVMFCLPGRQISVSADVSIWYLVCQFWLHQPCLHFSSYEISTHNCPLT